MEERTPNNGVYLVGRWDGDVFVREIRQYALAWHGTWDYWFELPPNPLSKAAPAKGVPHWPALYINTDGALVVTGGLYKSEETVPHWPGTFIRLVTEYPPVMIEEKQK